MAKFYSSRGINQKIRFTLSCHNIEYIVLYNMTVWESFSVKRDTIFLSRETSLYMLTYYYLTKSRVNRYEVTKIFLMVMIVILETIASTMTVENQIQKLQH